MIIRERSKGVASTFEVVRPGSRSGLLWVCQEVGVFSFCYGYMFILFLDTVLRCCPTQDNNFYLILRNTTHNNGITFILILLLYFHIIILIINCE